MTSGLCLRVSVLLAASAMVLEPAFGQHSGNPSSPPGSSGGNPGGTSPGTGNPGRPPSTGPATGQNPTTAPSEVARPIFLTGRVLLDDGTPPSERIAIQRVCNARPRTEGYTDSRGYFSIQLGADPSASLDDASINLAPPHGQFPDVTTMRPGGGVTERQLLGCELRAELPGYQSQSVNLSNRQPMDNPEIGTILLHRQGASEGTTVSSTTLAAPKDARKAYEKGLALAKKNKLDESQAEFEKAVAAYPHYAIAWCELGRLQAAKGQLDDARKSFAQSIQADQKFVQPYIETARLQLRAKQWQDLAGTTQTAIKLDPFTYPEAFFWNGVANYNLHKLDAAEESARRGEKLDTRHQIPELSHLMGAILADRHNYPAAAEQMRDYLKFAPGAQDADAVRSQLADLEKLATASTPASQPQ